ncbi:MAG: TRAP transporter small permease [Thermovirgaceae bacterium]
MLKKLNMLEEYFLVGTLAFNVVLIFSQVVMRYVFQNSLYWSEELARFVFLWFSWIGTSFAVREGAHLKVSMIADRLGGKAKSMLELMSLGIWLAFSIFLAFQGWKITSFIASMGQTSPALYIPMYLTYASVPTGSALMAARLLLELKKFLKGQQVPSGGEEALQ